MSLVPQFKFYMPLTTDETLILEAIPVIAFCSILSTSPCTLMRSKTRSLLSALASVCTLLDPKVFLLGVYFLKDLRCSESELNSCDQSLPEV